MGKEKEWTERKSKLTHKLTSVIIECKAAGIPMSSVVEMAEELYATVKLTEPQESFLRRIEDYGVERGETMSRENEIENAVNSGASRGWASAVIALLRECVYEEDVVTMQHFVLHQRLNQESNICVLCLCGVDGCLPNEGHHEDCSYARAICRTRGNRLSDYISRQVGART